MNTDNKDVRGLAEEIDAHLRAVRIAIRRPIENEIARGGLTGPQVVVMKAVVESGAVSLKELSKKVGLAHSTVSGIVDRLEKRRLLRREVDAGDRRATRIVVTDIVEEWMRESMQATLLHPLFEAVARSSEDERLAIVEGLRVLRRAMEKDG